MGLHCSVCDHNDREIIDGILAVGSLSRRTIANKFGLTDSAIQRHKTRHLSKRVAKVVEKARVKADDAFLDGITDSLVRSAQGATIGIEALASEDVDDATRARLGPAYAAQHLRALELLGNATGRLQQTQAGASSVNVVVVMPRQDQLPGQPMPTIDVPALDVTPTDE